MPKILHLQSDLLVKFENKNMNEENPLVSILTPTWNRDAYLDRVWNGLNSQTYKNIEWIVCDDGSSDDTANKLTDLRAKSTFPVTIISANVHIGKARMDNEAVAHSHGDFILWNDSDDYLLPGAIQQLIATWNTIPEIARKDYVGVTALCANERGVISTSLPYDGQFDTTWNDLREKYKVSGDMLYFTKSSVLKKHPFPEVDFVVPEGVVWTSIGNKKIRIQPEILKIVQYEALNCISFSKKMEYCRGRAYSLAVLEKNLKDYPKKNKVKLWTLITYIRCSIHGDLSFKILKKLWGRNSLFMLISIIAPIAYLFAAKDLVQRKVHKTHREFDVAKKKVVIKVEG